MSFRPLWTALLSATLAGVLSPAAAQESTPAPGPPATRMVDSVDVYHGVRVPAPYRWLEDIDSEAPRQWVEAQNEYTAQHLRQVPEREQIGTRLRSLWAYPKYGVPQRKGGSRYHRKNAGLQDHAVVYVRPTGSDAEPRVLFDPNAWSKDGTVSLSAFAPGPNGQYVAYGKSEGGSDWKTLYVHSLETDEALRDTLRWVKFSVPTWTADGEGFYYGRYPAPKEGEKYEDETKAQTIYYHEVARHSPTTGLSTSGPTIRRSKASTPTGTPWNRSFTKAPTERRCRCFWCTGRA